MAALSIISVLPTLICRRHCGTRHYMPSNTCAIVLGISSRSFTFVKRAKLRMFKLSRFASSCSRSRRVLRMGQCWRSSFRGFCGEAVSSSIYETTDQEVSYTKVGNVTSVNHSPHGRTLVRLPRLDIPQIVRPLAAPCQTNRGLSIARTRDRPAAPFCEDGGDRPHNT